KRNRVETSSIVGKTAKSNGRMVYTLTNSTTMASAILKEKNASRSMGGMGRVIMPSSISSRIGIDRLPFHRDLTLRRDDSRVTDPGTDFKCSNKETAIP